MNKEGSTELDGHLEQGRMEGRQKWGHCRGEGKSGHIKSGFGDKF